MDMPARAWQYGTGVAVVKDGPATLGWLERKGDKWVDMNSNAEYDDLETAEKALAENPTAEEAGIKDRIRKIKEDEIAAKQAPAAEASGGRRQAAAAEA